MKKYFRSLASMGLFLSLTLALSPSIAQAQVTSGPAEPNFVNLLDNGNFNIAQRGTTTVSSITTTAKYLWDRWAAYSGTATSAALTNVTSGVPAPFTNAAQVARTSGQTGILPVCLVQEIPDADIADLASQPVVVSFWAAAGANFSAASSNLTVKVTTGTSSDEGLATLISGWTGVANAINASQAITTSWQRYSWTGTLGAGIHEGAVQLCFTPVGTAGTSDYFQATGIQLQRGTVQSNFEWRPAGIELAKVQRFAYAIDETNTVASVVLGGGTALGTTTTCSISVRFPVTMRAAPTYTNALSATTFTITSASQAATVLGTPFSATLGANSVSNASINFTTTGMTAKDGCELTSTAAGSGKMLWTADF